MRLLIDIGNTSAKIAVCQGEDIIHFERREENWGSLFDRITDNFSINSCIVSNVARVDNELLITLERQVFPVTWLTYKTECPVKRECVAPDGLGADRWAADIGAMSLLRKKAAMSEDGKWDMPTLLVIDAGTCITYDLIAPDGHFIGGNISPGVELRLKSMHEHTALLPLIHSDGETPFMGYDTETAMRSGAVVGAELEIEGFVRRTLELYDDAQIFITGGDHFNFSDDILKRVNIEPMLVFKGLMCIPN